MSETKNFASDIGIEAIVAAGVAMGVGIIASAGAGVMAYRQEVRQNNNTTEAPNQ